MEKFIKLIKCLVLSVVQGVGEVLPISSSGHLLLVRNIMEVDGGVGLEIVLHVASLFALFIYYRRVIFSVIKGCFFYVFRKQENYKKDFVFFKGMVICLIPTCLVGYFFNDYLDVFFKYPVFIGMFLVFNGVNLYLVRKKEGVKRIYELSNFSFFKIGLGQCFGLVPGFSRSGSALSMCYREGVCKEDGEKFTFLMLFPLVIGSLFLNINELSFYREDVLLLGISFVFTVIVTLFSMCIFRRMVKNNKLSFFACYSIFIGGLIVFLL